METAQFLRDGQRVALNLEHLPGVVQHPVLEFVTQTVGQSRSYHPDIDAIFINALDPHILEAERP